MIAACGPGAVHARRELIPFPNRNQAGKATIKPAWQLQNAEFRMQTMRSC
jgi:hypothetical protein